MNLFYRLLALLSALMMMFVAVGCRKEEKKDITVHYIGAELNYVSDAQKSAWKEPLQRLLGNVRHPYGEGGEVMGERPRDPNAPSVPDGLAFGLFDITGDGVPELMIHQFGSASSGVIDLGAYDIETGEMIGSVGGNGGSSWCYYYDTQSGLPKVIGRYRLRYGWSGRSSHIVTLTETEEGYVPKELFYLGDEIDMVELTDESGNPYYEEVYPDTDYRFGGEVCSLDAYYYALDVFLDTHIRLVQTELQLFSWEDVSPDSEDEDIRAVRMAEALTTSQQQFILPNGTR